MTSFKSKHQGHYQWSEVQALVRNFAEQLRQRHKTDISSSDLTQDSLSELVKTQPKKTPYSARQESEFSHQREIDLDSFRQAWQIKQKRSINPQTGQAQETKNSISVQNQAHQKEDLTKTSNAQWDFEQNHLVAKPASSKVELGNRPVSADQAVNIPISNPWEMLRDHFIALRERRLALEKASENQEDS